MRRFSSLALLLVLYWTRRAYGIENKESSNNNIGHFVGQLTSLLNQVNSGVPGTSPGVIGYQSGGYPPPGPEGYPPLGPGGYPTPGPEGYPPPGPGGYPPPGPAGPFAPPGPFGYRPLPPGLLGGYPGQGLGAGGAPSSLIGALSSIARYDDLRCVPRLLCEVASGARPGSYSTYPSSQESPVPFLSKDALVTLLTVLNFVDESPLLVFGRAALLGYTARGDSRACLVAYPTCPRDPDRLVDYLNNHNGGFFRFFNQQLQQYAPQYQQYQPPYPGPPYPPHGPPYPPQGPSYPPQGTPYPPQGPPYPPQGPPYQPQGPPYPPQGPYIPQRPPRPYHPRPQPGYPQQYSVQNQRYQYQSRIQTKPESALEFDHYSAAPHSDNANQLAFAAFQDAAYQESFGGTLAGTKSKLVFPHRGDSKKDYKKIKTSSHSTRGGKTLSFPSDSSGDHSSNRLPTYDKPVTMVFPDRTGTGDLRLDVDEYGDYKTVYYQSLRDDRGQRQVAFPQSHKMQFPTNRPHTGSSPAHMHFPH